MGPGFAAIGKLKGIEPMATKHVRWIFSNTNKFNNHIHSSVPGVGMYTGWFIS